MKKIPEYLVERFDGCGLEWIRKCPKCNEDIIHKNFTSAKNCHKQKRLCYTCGSWNKGLTKHTNSTLKKMGEKQSEWMLKFRKKIPPWNKGLTKKNSEILERMGKGHTGFRHTEETKRIIGEYSERFWKDPEYRKIVTEAVNENRNIDQWRETMEKLGYFTPLEQKSEWERYKQLVWYYTNQNELSALPNSDKRARLEVSGSYSLDHKFSISKGFKEKISPEIIGSIHNVEFIPSRENDSKKTNCSITKETLLHLYGNSENQI